MSHDWSSQIVRFMNPLSVTVNLVLTLLAVLEKLHGHGHSVTVKITITGTVITVTESMCQKCSIKDSGPSHDDPVT